MAKLGIRVEDSGPQGVTTWIKEDPKMYLEKMKKKEIEKNRKLKIKEEARALMELKKSTPPTEWYKTFESDKYSQFNEKGVPTHDSNRVLLKDEIFNGLKKQMNSKIKKYMKKTRRN